MWKESVNCVIKLKDFDSPKHYYCSYVLLVQFNHTYLIHSPRVGEVFHQMFGRGGSARDNNEPNWI